jgi:hypothetical protein
MRRTDEKTGALFSYLDLGAAGLAEHPLQAIRSLVNEAHYAMACDLSALRSGLAGRRSHLRSCCDAAAGLPL